MLALQHNQRGIVSMANNGPDSNGAQFFITYAKQGHLDRKYTVFGKYVFRQPAVSRARATLCCQVFC